ncbi:MAG: NAAT family transporter [Stigonema ocellatum SAG 48.90 = DSM 106950]|nr:NAAT family transporter [Stigonema ocellatum SAG 48.90 = DSM 106950]
MDQHVISSAVGTFISLFPIANPVGAVPVFYSLTSTDTPSYRKRQARQTALNVIWILAVSLVGGRSILQFFGISLGVLRIAGGLLVAHTAWEMVASRQRLTESEHKEAVDKEDVSFTPMAIPLVSGPGAIGVVIGLSAKITQWSDYFGCLVGIALLALLLYLCLTLGDSLINGLGKNGIGALNRVLGFFILAIAVQLIADGVLSLLVTSIPRLFR